MKAKVSRSGKGWLENKLTSQKFRKGFDAEVQKLAIGEQLSRLRQEAGLHATRRGLSVWFISSFWFL
ncbi:MAG: hypothetical protein HOP00_10000 [Nitrospira sp.]|nr:hypothetical protein [Nitrospira sp.]